MTTTDSRTTTKPWLYASNVLADPRNHSLIAMWSGKEFSPRHAMAPHGMRTICGAKADGWQVWDYSWHGYVAGAGDACKRCVKATRA